MVLLPDRKLYVVVSAIGAHNETVPSTGQRVHDLRTELVVELRTIHV